MNREHGKELLKKSQRAHASKCGCGAPPGECWSQSGSMGGKHVCDRERHDGDLRQFLWEHAEELLA